jgi:hypothetical protein
LPMMDAASEWRCERQNGLQGHDRAARRCRFGPMTAALEHGRPHRQRWLQPGMPRGLLPTPGTAVGHERALNCGRGQRAFWRKWTPERLRPLAEGYRYAAFSTSYAGVEQRWLW